MCFIYFVCLITEILKLHMKILYICIIYLILSGQTNFE